MNKQTLVTKTCGEITLLDMVDRGGQGEIYATTCNDYYVKVCAPADIDIDDNKEILKIKNTMASRYRIFCQLKFEKDKEVTCLPLEYFEVDYNGPTPAYLMKKAEGERLDRIMQELSQADLNSRMLIARSLVNGLSFLRSRSVIHADFKPNNFFFDKRSGHIQILDIDGGGYYGDIPGTEKFWPGVPAPIQLYRAPELVYYSWRKLWEKTDWNSTDLLITQPDLWSLAVMLYQILVDVAGPFPTHPTRADIPGYKKFDREAYCSGSPKWPMRWQQEMMQSQRLDSGLIERFEAVFSATNRMQPLDNPKNPKRPGPESWRAAIDKALQSKKKPGKVARGVPALGEREEARKVLSRSEGLAMIASIPAALFWSTKFFTQVLGLSSSVLFFLSFIGIAVLSLRSTFAPMIGNTIRGVVKGDQDMITRVVIAVLTIIILGAASEWAAPFTITLFPTLIVLSRQLYLEKQLTERFQKEGITDSSRRAAGMIALVPVLALTFIMFVASFFR